MSPKGTDYGESCRDCTDFDTTKPYEPCAKHRIARERNADGKCACRKTVLSDPDMTNLDDHGWWHQHHLCFRGPR